MKVAIVILNWNGEQMLRQFLPSVVEHSVLPPSLGEAVVYVADNGSTDGSLALLAESFPTVRTIALGENYGFAEGYNKAFEHIDAEYAVLLNSDVEVTAGWLAPLVAYMDAHPRVGACQPKLMAYHQKGQFEYAGAMGGYLDRYGYPYCRGSSSTRWSMTTASTTPTCPSCGPRVPASWCALPYIKRWEDSTAASLPTWRR